MSAKHHSSPRTLSFDDRRALDQLYQYVEQHYLVDGENPLSLAEFATCDERMIDTSKKESQALLKEFRTHLNRMQHLLFADNKRSLLMVLQGMDGSGKDSTIRRVFGGVNPQGIKVNSFKRPTDIELSHDYLWRVHQVTPRRGMIGLFNRSHYEDVLVPYIDGLITREHMERRLGHINDFERQLSDEGTHIVKVFLHLSKEEQKQRLEERLANPEKRWKFEMADIDKRAEWDDYQAHYAEVIRATSTTQAPWFIIPADSKWRRDLMIMAIAANQLASMPLTYPKPQSGLDDIVIQ